MKASELRIGNLVEILTTTRDTMIPLPTGKYGEINNIRQDKVQIKYIFETNPEKHVLFNRSHNTIRPIPLTEEWLVKFGWNYYIHESVYKKWGKVKANDYVYRYTIIQSDKGFVHPTSDGGVKLNYVHQLQNLYFALTGEELTIKE